MENVDSEKLISLVQERTPLWDLRTKCYHNRDVGRKLWIEIAEELNSSSQVVKNKWKCLRVTFRKEFFKISSAATGSEATCSGQSSWKFFQNLQFLSDVCCSRPGKGNIQPVAVGTGSYRHSGDKENSCSDENVNSEFEKNVDANDDLIKNVLQKPNMIRKRKNVSDKETAINELVILEKNKIEELQKLNYRIEQDEKEKQDDDYHFLMSLLPHMREIPKRLKLGLRVKMLQLLESIDVSEEEEGTRTSFL